MQQHTNCYVKHCGLISEMIFSCWTVFGVMRTEMWKDWNTRMEQLKKLGIELILPRPFISYQKGDLVRRRL